MLCHMAVNAVPQFTAALHSLRGSTGLRLCTALKLSCNLMASPSQQTKRCVFRNNSIANRALCVQSPPRPHTLLFSLPLAPDHPRATPLPAPTKRRARPRTCATPRPASRPLLTTPFTSRTASSSRRECRARRCRPSCTRIRWCWRRAQRGPTPWRRRRQW